MAERDRNRPLEQPHTRALVNALLDYLANLHGSFVEIIVRDWLKKKEARLAWKNKEEET